MEIILIGIGCIIFGYCVGYIVSGYNDVGIKNRRNYLEKEFMRLTSELSRLERDYRKSRESFLDLRRRYDKIYSNNYNKFK